MFRFALRIALVATICLCALPAVAQAAWPGTNGAIYFACEPVGSTFDGVDICAVNPDGTGLVNLTNTPDTYEGSPSVSRDGRKLAFVRGPSGGDKNAWVMNTDGSGQVQVNSVPTDGPSFTPDGRVTFRGEVQDNVYEFQAVPQTGGPATTFYSANITGSSYPPFFDTAGSFLYARSVQIPAQPTWTQQIFKVVGGAETQLTFGALGLSSNQQPSWSPDASTIVFTRRTGGDSDIWTVSSSGGEPVRRTFTPDSVAEESQPQFSPDGQKLLWIHADSTYDFFTSQIAIANTDGSGMSLVPLPTIRRARGAVWSSTPVPASFGAKAAKKLKRTKKLSLTLDCSGGTACVISYGAKLTVPRKGRKALSFKIKTQSVTLADAEQRVVKLSLPSRAKKALKAALKAKKKPSLKISIKADQPDGVLIKNQTLKVTITK